MVMRSRYLAALNTLSPSAEARIMKATRTAMAIKPNFNGFPIDFVFSSLCTLRNTTWPVTGSQVSSIPRPN